jgi:hypothetical protein
MSVTSKSIAFDLPPEISMVDNKYYNVRHIDVYLSKHSSHLFSIEILFSENKLFFDK